MSDEVPNGYCFNCGDPIDHHANSKGRCLMANCSCGTVGRTRVGSLADDPAACVRAAKEMVAQRWPRSHFHDFSGRGKSKLIKRARRVLRAAETGEQ